MIYPISSTSKINVPHPNQCKHCKGDAHIDESRKCKGKILYMIECAKCGNSEVCVEDYDLISAITKWNSENPE